MRQLFRRKPPIESLDVLARKSVEGVDDSMMFVFSKGLTWSGQAWIPRTDGYNFKWDARRKSLRYTKLQRIGE